MFEGDSHDDDDVDDVDDRDSHDDDEWACIPRVKFAPKLGPLLTKRWSKKSCTDDKVSINR